MLAEALRARKEIHNQIRYSSDEDESLPPPRYKGYNVISLPSSDSLVFSKSNSILNTQFWSLQMASWELSNGGNHQSSYIGIDEGSMFLGSCKTIIFATMTSLFMRFLY